MIASVVRSTGLNSVKNSNGRRAPSRAGDDAADEAARLGAAAPSADSAAFPGGSKIDHPHGNDEEHDAPPRDQRRRCVRAAHSGQCGSRHGRNDQRADAVSIEKLGHISLNECALRVEDERRVHLSRRGDAYALGGNRTVVVPMTHGALHIAQTRTWQVEHRRNFPSHDAR
jgi:hypothetical protein